MPGPRQVKSFWSKVKKSEGCWEWTGKKSPKGYALHSMRGFESRGHRIAWRFTFGEIPSGMVVCHRCDNRGCVNPAHLFVGTQLDNVRDMHAKGRARKHVGATHHNARLDDNKVREIRALIRGGNSFAGIGRQFGVSYKAIAQVDRGVTWAHVT